MNQVSLSEKQVNSSFYPTVTLESFANAKNTGYLTVYHNAITWRIYLQKGQLFYATHSLDPFERLERHLRRLSQEAPSLTAAVCNQARLQFESYSQSTTDLPCEYTAISWLVEKQYLKPLEATQVSKKLTQEVFESYLLLTKASYEWTDTSDFLSLYFQASPSLFVENCQQKLQKWQALAPVILSPDQCPYFSMQNQGRSQLSLQQKQKLSKLCRGFSFRQLAVLTNTDELILAQHLYPLIADQTIVLRDRPSPFDRLPLITNFQLESEKKIANTVVASPKQLTPPNVTDSSSSQLQDDQNTNDNLPTTPISEQHYTIVCVDDSPTILREIQRFLGEQNLTTHTIADSTRAIMEIMRIKPDLILLDIGMPGIDGYKLCRLLRNHRLFKTTPIVMVTSNTGLFDRAKARVAGCTDYLTKPFNQAQLLKIVFRYLITYVN